MQYLKLKNYAVSLFILIAVAALVSALPVRCQTIVITTTGSGRVFDGVGAISGGGGNSRLLIDYPEPYRSQILDYLFKPHYGANLQILKVEIGGDMDSTDGSEPSHMHTRSDENYNRGYEWWLMEQARLRNPNITLVALPWGAPYWVGNGDYWSSDMIEYIIKWLKHAESNHHLTINYVGGRNEHGYNKQWYKDFKAALRSNNLSSVKVIAVDEWSRNSIWAIATYMKNDPVLNSAIDVVGAHCTGWECHPEWNGDPTPDALSLRKPLWDSEAHFDQKFPSSQVADTINRNYVVGRITATIFWPIISAIYDNLPFSNVGLIRCNQPWSGYYTVTPSLWVIAQTAQFTKPGWLYINSASGFLHGDTTDAHGSYVTLKSPDDSNYSTIINTVDAKEAQTVHFSILGFPKKTVHVWTTNPASADPSAWFAKQSDILPAHGKFSLILFPGRMYTLTTTTGQQKGDARPPASAPFPFPYTDNFDEYPTGKSAKYFSDIYGVFETAKCAGGRSGTCLRQVVPEEPIAWKKSSNRPFTILGNLDWSDYQVSSDVLLEEPGSVELIGRLSGMSYPDIPNSYVLRVSNAGAWSLLKTTTKEVRATLASGTVSPLGIDHWHNLSLIFQGEAITAQIDHMTIRKLTDPSFAKGMVGLGVVGYTDAQFDNFKVKPLNRATHPDR